MYYNRESGFYTQTKKHVDDFLLQWKDDLKLVMGIKYPGQPITF